MLMLSQPKSNAMKKFVCIIIPVFFLVFLFLISNIDNGSPQFPASLDLNQVSSISLYYTNDNQKKEIIELEDISTILLAISASTSHGSYTRVPDGGQTFLILVHLNNGSQYSCVYNQTEESSGYYSDGIEHMRLSSLDFASIWKELSYPVIPAHATHEFSDWPTL